MRILRISSPFLVALACYYTRRTENKNGAFVPLFYKSITELILRKKIKGIQTEQIDCAFCDWSCSAAPVTKGAINLLSYPLQRTLRWTVEIISAVHSPAQGCQVKQNEDTQQSKYGNNVHVVRSFFSRPRRQRGAGLTKSL